MSIFFLHEADFPKHDNIKYVCIVIGGDYGKGAFAALMTMRIEAHNSSDEVVGEIDSAKDDAEVLRYSANKIRKGFTNCNISHITRNMCIAIGTCKVTAERKVFFNNFIEDSNCNLAYQLELEVFRNSDIKH